MSKNLFIERNIFQDLKEWKDRRNHKPLIIRGPRQVGKTTIIKEFGKQYKQFVYFNLEPLVDLHLFDNNLGIDALLQSAFLAKNASLDETDTLMFIDEIQESPQTIQRLRYIYEEYPHLDTIAAGSLLDFVLGDIKSFPVGRVEYLSMHPFGFVEFLRALGKQQAIKALKVAPIEAHYHQIFLTLFHSYAMVGGMPEVASLYGQTEDMTSMQHLYDALLVGYQNDVEKYAIRTKDRDLLRHLVTMVPYYAEQRITFEKFGGSNYRSREVGENLRVMEKARLISLIYPITNTKAPNPNRRKKPRLQFLDCGLTIHRLQSHQEIISLSDLNDATRGRIAQQVVGQNIVASQTSALYQNHFWVREVKGDAEVDFVYSFKGLLIPIEVKSGATGKLRSLMEFLDRSEHGFGVRMYGGTYSIQNLTTMRGKKFRLMNLPYYLSGQLREYLDLLVN